MALPALALVAFSSLVSCHVPVSDAGRANVVWILLDACRADHLSAYGYPRPTSPQIERLARRGATFLTHYANASNTIWSVPSYLTGRFETGLYQDPGHLNLWLLRTPPADELLLSAILARNGYATAMFSASPWYTERSRLGRSFDEFGALAHGADVPAVSFQERNPTLFDWVEARGKSPFFLYVHSLDTHGPRYRNNTAETWLDPVDSPAREAQLRAWRNGSYTAADRAQLTNLYDGGIAYADSTVGELVAHLESLGLLERSIVIVASDHGEALGQDGATVGHPGGSSFDDVLEVPLVIAGPGIPGGIRITLQTQNVDIVPTLVDLLSLSTPARFDGRSLRPLLEGSAEQALHRFVTARSIAVVPNTARRIVIEGGTKYVFSQRGLAAPDTLASMEARSWAMPDRLGGRRAGTPGDGERARAESHMTSTLLPAWRAVDRLPREAPASFELGHRGSLRPDQVSAALDPADGRWTLQRFQRPESEPRSFYREELLIGFPGDESPPELRLEQELPNGSYAVAVYSRTVDMERGARDVSFSLRAGEQAEFQSFTLPRSRGRPEEAWFDLGVHTVTDSRFRYGIRAGSAPAIAVVGPLRFRKVGSDAGRRDPGGDRELHERLRALGYAE